MILSPLEQFEIIPLLSCFTNSSLFILIVVTTCISFLSLSAGYGATLFVPNAWQGLAEMLYTFVFDFASETVGEEVQPYFPFLFTIFNFVLFSNLIGLIPYSFTVTSHIIITFGLAYAVFVGINIIGFKTHGLHFFSMFLPKGASLALAPFLVVIELVSYTFRVFSLAIRLFANIMAGHTLLKILSGFAWTMLSMGGVFYILHLIPLLIVIAVIGLELGIAFLQAYVFTVLTCLYLHDALELH